MAESTLSYKLSDLEGDVGLFLGFGRGAANGDPAWSASTQAVIDLIVKSGLRQFYFPPPIDGRKSSYDWSFLKPVANLTVTAGVVTVALPDDFGGVEGQATIQSTGQSYYPIDITGVGVLYAQESKLPSTTGRPLMACVEPLKATTATAGQRFQLRVWPTPDAGYTLQAAYYVLADFLTGGAPYALGGMAHAETILESCLAIAEQRLDDASSVHSQKFMERLTASVSFDRRLKPQNLGYNGDGSDGRELARRAWAGFPGITYRGTQY